MSYLVVSFVVILFTECVFRGAHYIRPKEVKELLERSLTTFFSKSIPDREKQVLLFQYSWHILLNSLRIGALLFVVFGSFLLVCYILDIVLPLDPPALKLLVTSKGLLLASLVSLVYCLARFKF